MSKISYVLLPDTWHLVLQGMVLFPHIWLSLIVEMGLKGFVQE